MITRTVVIWALYLTISRVVLAAPDGQRCATVSRDNLVSCALSASFALKRAEQDGKALEGRAMSARPWLPSNPMVSGSLARRLTNGSNPTTTNWTATLAQELDLSGQRGARVGAAENDALAQKWRTVGTARDAAALAWLAYFDTLASKEDLALAAALQSSAETLSLSAAARARNGLLPQIDADVADIAFIKAQQARMQAELRNDYARARLTMMTGGATDSDVAVQNDTLRPLASAESAAPAEMTSNRPELRALQLEQKAFAARASLFRRARVPNITLSAFAQNDGYDERVYGFGLGLPLAIPGLGKTYAGDIAEAEAMAEKTQVDTQRVQREVSLELRRTRQQLDARRRELTLFDDTKAIRIEKMLAEITTEQEAGRFSIRDAVIARERLTEFLQGRIEAKHALCVASVEHAQAAGVPLEKGAQ